MVSAGTGAVSVEPLEAGGTSNCISAETGAGGVDVDVC